MAGFTYVSTWQAWLYVAFVIDVFARPSVAKYGGLARQQLDVHRLRSRRAGAGALSPAVQTRWQEDIPGHITQATKNWSTLKSQ